MKENKEYYAFISYKREDEKWAKWLQEKLEHYKFPTNLNGRADLPKSIRPTFRDVTDLKPGLLAEEINNALCNSEWLIVVCSPRSAKSPWVCKEAQTFIDLGRADHIIPFVIEGNPFSNNIATECYPKALLNLTGSEELLAANINEMGRDAAAIKVVARMFNLRFDVLWQRHEREQRRKRWMWVGGSILFAFVSLVIGGIIAWQNKELDAKNKEVVAERDRANLEKDRAEKANTSLLLANDSILKQSQQILNQRDSLNLSNKLLAEERDNVLKANWEIKKKHAHIVSEKGLDQINDNNSYLARQMAVEILPVDVEAPNYPLTMEGEYLLRNAMLYDNAILKGHNDEVLALTLSPDGKRIISASRDKTIRTWDMYTGELIFSFSCDYKADMIEIYNSYDLNNALSHDKKLLASYWGTDSICIYDIENGRQYGKTLRGHTGMINSAVFSYNGKYIISSSNDKTVRIWDIKSGEQIGPLFEHESEVTFATINSDNKYIVSALSDNTIYIWDVKRGIVVEKIETHGMKSKGIVNIEISPNGKMICCVIEEYRNLQSFLVREINTDLGESNNRGYNFSSDGRRLVLKESGNFSIYNMRTGIKEKKSFEGHSDFVNSALFSPYGNFVVSASADKTIRVWDSNTGKEIRKPLIGHSDDILCATFSCDGKKIISASADKTIRIWDVDDGRDDLITFENDNFDVDGACYSPTGNHILTWGDKIIRIFNVFTQKWDELQLKGHTGSIEYASYNYNGTMIVSASADSTIRIWDAKTGYELLNPLEGHSGKVVTVSFSYDGNKIVSASADSTIRIWDVKTGEQIGPPMYHENYVKCAFFSPDGKSIVSTSYDKTTRIWDVKSGKQIGIPLTGHTDDVNFVVFSPDGDKIVSASVDKTIRMWDAKSGKQIGAPLTGHTDDVNFVAFSLDGEKLVSASYDKTIRIWDIKSGKQIGTPLTGHTGWVNSVAFSPDGDKIVSAKEYGNEVIIWNTKTGKSIVLPLNLRGHADDVNSVAFSPDGDKIVSASADKTIRMWNAKSGKQIGKPLTGHTQWVNSVTFSHDGNKIVSASNDNTIRIWDVKSGKQIGTPLTGHTGWVNSVAFSHDGDKIVSASNDKTIRVWDVKLGKQIGTPLTGHTGWVNSVAFSRDGNKIVSASKDKTIRFWDIKNGKQIGDSIDGDDFAMSPDGKSMIVLINNRNFIVINPYYSKKRENKTEECKVYIIDVETGLKIGDIPTKGITKINDISFSPSGKQIIFSNDNQIRLWKYPNLQELINRAVGSKRMKK